MDASKSYDPDSVDDVNNGIRFYHWAISDKYNNIVLEWSSTEPVQEVILDEGGTYSVELSVSDDDGTASENELEERSIGLDVFTAKYSASGSFGGFMLMMLFSILGSRLCRKSV